MIGGAGNDEMHDSQVVDPSPEEGSAGAGPQQWQASSKSGAWTVVVDEGYFGVGKVTIVDDSTLDFVYYRTSSGEQHDSFTLKRDHSRYQTSA